MERHRSSSATQRGTANQRGIATRRITGIIFLLALALAAASSAQLVPITGVPYPLPVPYSPLKQSGFEIPDQGTGPGAYAYLPSGSAWTFAGNTGLAGNGSEFTQENPPAPQGDQVLFVQGGSGSIVSQSFAVSAGRYRFSMRAAQRIHAGNTNDQTISVRVDGSEVDQIRPTDGTYAAFATHSFVIGLGFHTVELVGLNPQGGDNTLLVDQLKLVSLAQVGDAWSNPATWGGTVPGSSDAVTIPAGQIVILDTAAQVQSLTVDGELHCKDKNISLAAEWIMVGGRFECGSEISPYVNRLTLTLTGADDGDDIMGMGDKFLGAMGSGVIELHGAPRLSWTQLDATAAAGSTSLTVADAVDWRVGDQIVVAPTHEAYDEGEVVTLTSVSADGLTLGISPSLAHQHWGEKTDYDNGTTTWTLDERAEVGLLSRNIKIQGDLSADPSGGFGGHMMSMLGTTVRTEGVEFFQMGQKGKLGRYPFHWHLVDSAPGQYIRNSSIHRSFNRCVTVHRTHDTLVADNVCYDFIGHGYFLEDGNEERNVFDHNLGIWAKKPLEAEALLETDYRVGTASNGPAAFWIAHPNNTYTDNAAAGSEGTGFWYGSSDEVVPGTSIIPMLEPFGTFRSNRAHSSRQGFSSCTDKSGPFGMNPPNEALIEDLTVTNNEQGIWPCASPQTKQNARFLRAIVANARNGMQAPNPMTFEDSLFVAYTDNAPLGATGTAGVNWRAVQVYDQGFLFDNVHFVNYDRPAMTAFYPGAGAHKLVNNRGDGLTFDNSPHVFLDPDNFAKRPENGPGWWGDVVHDLGGTFAGLDQAVVSPHPLMFDGNCTQPTHIEIAGYVCPHRYAHFRSENFWAEDPEQVDAVTVLRSDGTHETAEHIHSRFINEFILGDTTYYTYRYTAGMKHEVMRFDLRNAFVGDTAIYEILDVPDTFTVNDGAWTATANLRDLFEGPGSQYYWREGSLFLKMLVTSGEDWHALDSVNVCMTGSCAQGTEYILDLPTVDITSPADGARFPVGTPITVTANLSDTQGIASARLYVGVTKKGTDTTAPYSWTLNNLPAGSYPLKLVATDTTGQTYTAVQQLFVGEPGPRVEITSHQDHQTFDSSDTLQVAFNVHNWTVTPGGTHLRWLLDNIDQGPLYTLAPFTVSGLSQGKHEIRIALAEADNTIRAINDTITVYGVENHMLADFEDGVDPRGSLTPFDANMGFVAPIKFAWGTRDPVASRNDSQDPINNPDDINYYTVGNNGDGVDSWATYRLDLDPAQDWSSFTGVEIKAGANLSYECFVVDATSGRTSLGTKSGTITTLSLPGSSALVDEVVAIELRYYESTINPGTPKLQHLHHIRLVP